MQHTIKERLLFSTELNGIEIPFSSLSGALAKYVTNLVVMNDDPVYRVSLCGSATPIRFMDRFFLACCHHQLEGRRLEDVGLLSGDGKTFVTSAGVRHFVQKTDSDRSDLVVFDFTEPCRDHLELQPRFYHLRDIPPDAPNVDTLFLQVSGFPSRVQRYELEEKNHLGLVKHKVICDLDAQSHDHAVLRLKTLETLTVDPDGMSGGSTFTVQMVHGRPKAFLAGVTLRGGYDHFHILKVGYIRSFLKSIVDGDVQQRPADITVGQMRLISASLR